MQHLDWKIVSSFGVICFGLVGLELGSVMGDEIDDPGRVFPEVFCSAEPLPDSYIWARQSRLLLAIPPHDVSVVQGILQGIDNMTGRFGASWALVPVAFLLSVCDGRCYVGLAKRVSTHLVCFWHRPLPAGNVRQKSTRSMGRRTLQSSASRLSLLYLIAMSFVGKTTVKEAYVTLLDLAVVLQMISYLYLYASLAKIAFSKSAAKVLEPGGLDSRLVGGLISHNCGRGRSHSFLRGRSTPSGSSS